MQDFLVQLANQSDIVRDYLGVKDWKNIVKITDNSVHRFVGFKDGKPQIQARFIGHRRDLGVSNILMRFAQDDVFKHLDRKYQYSESVMFQSVWKPQLVKYATASFNPASGANSPVDGRVGRAGGVNETFAVITSTADGNQASAVVGANADMATLLVNNYVSDRWSDLWRSIFLFDTSSLSGATVSSADFKLYINSANDTTIEDNQTVALVSSLPASNSNIANGDYDSLGTTRFATDIGVDLLTGAAYNTFSLNATGIVAIDTSGISKFGLRLGCDADGASPTWGTNKNIFVKGTFADAGSNEPTLDVIYVGGTTNQKNLLLLGVG